MNRPNQTQKQASAKTVREQSMGWMLKALSTDLDKQIITALKPYGLNLGQFAILMTLFEGDGIIQSDIGKKISMPGYATTRNIDALEQSGLLERLNDELSRRSYRIHLTEKGRSLAPDLFKIVKNINAEAMAVLTEDESVLLKQLLSKLLK